MHECCGCDARFDLGRNDISHRGRNRSIFCVAAQGEPNDAIADLEIIDASGTGRQNGALCFAADDSAGGKSHHPDAPISDHRLGNGRVDVREGEKGNEHIDVVDADKVVLDQDLAISRNRDG